MPAMRCSAAADRRIGIAFGQAGKEFDELVEATVERFRQAGRHPEEVAEESQAWRPTGTSQARTDSVYGTAGRPPLGLFLRSLPGLRRKAETSGATGQPRATGRNRDAADPRFGAPQPGLLLRQMPEDVHRAAAARGPQDGTPGSAVDGSGR